MRTRTCIANSKQPMLFCAELVVHADSQVNVCPRAEHSLHSFTRCLHFCLLEPDLSLTLWHRLDLAVLKRQCGAILGKSIKIHFHMMKSFECELSLMSLTVQGKGNQVGICVYANLNSQKISVGRRGGKTTLHMARGRCIAASVVIAFTAVYIILIFFVRSEKTIQALLVLAIPSGYCEKYIIKYKV